MCAFRGFDAFLKFFHVIWWEGLFCYPSKSVGAIDTVWLCTCNPSKQCSVPTELVKLCIIRHIAEITDVTSLQYLALPRIENTNLGSLDNKVVVNERLKLADYQTSFCQSFECDRTSFQQIVDFRTANTILLSIDLYNVQRWITYDWGHYEMIDNVVING